MVTRDMHWAGLKGDIVKAKRVSSDVCMLVEQLYLLGSAQVHILGLDVGNLHGVHLLVVVHVADLSREHLEHKRDEV